MAKVKPTPEAVVKYFTDNAGKDKIFSQAIKKYAKSYELSNTTIANILNSTGKAKEIKALYKNTGSNPIQIGAKTIEIKPEVAPIEEAVSIATLAVSNNPLDGLNIRSLEATLPNGAEIEIANDQIAVNRIWMDRSELAIFPEAAKKALEIFDYIYKK